MKPIYNLLFIFGLLVFPLIAQEPASQDEQTITGRVTSFNSRTMVIRSEDGNYHLYVFDSNSTRPRTISAGSTVRVISVPGADSGARLTRRVVVLNAAAAGTPQSASNDDVIPPAVRQVERDIERSVRRFGVGVRAGATLDPELLTVGLQANLGSIFTQRLTLRPNAEFAFGEVTKMFGLNLDAMYRLPFSPRQGRWSAYVGGGPGFFLIDQNFERAAQGDKGVNFDDFDFQAGLNVFSGVQFRSGMFMEARTTVYAVPHLRLIVGYNF